jgi:nucleoside-diphosphate-sugar epimerase
LKNILITGATGFVGQALIKRLDEEGHLNTAALRRHADALPVSTVMAQVPDICAGTDWSRALRNQDVVIHCAARVHIMNESSSDPLAAFRSINVEGTLNLARQAADAGASRLIYLSSVKVNGEKTFAGQPFRADDVAAPEDPYGRSKHEAEVGLRELSLQTGLEVVIVRPPLIYGPGVKANFFRLIQAVHRGWPLPLGSIGNKRSLVALDNLLDVIVTCVEHPHAANETFLVSDGEDLSTPQLLRKIGFALGKPARLIPVPMVLLKLAGGLTGQGEAVQRLCGSLQVDIHKTRELLDWTPPLSVDEGLKRVAEEYLRETTV